MKNIKRCEKQKEKLAQKQKALQITTQIPAKFTGATCSVVTEKKRDYTTNDAKSLPTPSLILPQ